MVQWRSVQGRFGDGVQRGQAEGTQPQTLIFVGGGLLGLMVEEGKGEGTRNFSRLLLFSESQRKTEKNHEHTEQNREQ